MFCPVLLYSAPLATVSLCSALFYSTPRASDVALCFPLPLLRRIRSCQIFPRCCCPSKKSAFYIERKHFFSLQRTLPLFSDAAEQKVRGSNPPAPLLLCIIPLEDSFTRKKYKNMIKILCVDMCKFDS